MDVERRAEVLGRHGRALQVPAGPAGPPRRVPGGFPRLGALPEGEVPRVAFGVGGVGVLGGPHVLEALPGQGAVGRPGSDIEVHVAARGVGVPAVDEPPHERDHLRDVAGGPRFHIRGDAAEHVVGAAERPLVALCHGPPRDALVGGHPDDLVVDVGDVPAERDLVAARLQPADQDVEIHPGPDVPDVRWCLHRGATQVQRSLPRLDRGELALGARCCVMEAERHAAKATVAGPASRPIIPPREPSAAQDRL